MLNYRSVLDKSIVKSREPLEKILKAKTCLLLHFIMSRYLLFQETPQLTLQ